MKNLQYIIIVFYSLMFINASSAQSWQWFNQIGSSLTSQFFPDEYVNDMEVDKDGNIYICGRTFAGAELNGSPLPGFGDQDAFVAKFNCSGQLLWYHVAGSANQADEYFEHMELSTNNRLYLTGRIVASASNPGTVIDTTFSTVPTGFILLCLDTAGNRKWLKFNGGSGCAAPSNSVGSDSNGFLYVLGSNNTNCQIYPNLNIPICYRYVAKLDSNGNALSFFVLDTIPADDFEVDADGNLYFTGSIGAAYNVGGQLVSPIGMYDLIVVKYDSAGNYKWHYKTGVANGGSIGKMVKIDPVTRDVWVAANMSLNTPIGTDTITNSYSMSCCVSAAIKLSQSGSVLHAYQANNKAPPYNEFIDVTNNDKVYFGGTYPGVVKIGADSLISNGQYDIFFAEIDKVSNQLKLKSTLNCTGFRDENFQLCHDGQGNLYFAGAFDGTASVNSQNYTYVGGKTDAFVAKWGYTSCTTGIEDLNGQDKNTLQITPNPASSLINIFAKQLYSKKATLYIYDITGQLIYHSVFVVSNSCFNTSINIQHFANGFYTVVLQTDNERSEGRLMQKFVKE